MRKTAEKGINDLHDVEAEKSVIGSILIDKEALLEIDYLQPNHFFNDEYKEIYRAIIDLQNQRKSIDIVTLSSQLKENGKYEAIGGSSEITSCVNGVPTAVNIKNYADIVYNHARKRILIGVLREGQKDIFNTNTNTDDLIIKIENTVLKATQQPTSEKLLPDSDNLKSFLEEIYQRKELNNTGKYPGLDTGYKHLNEVTLGLQAEFLIIGARPSLGKTTFLRQLIDNVAMNNPNIPCMFVSYEQSKNELLFKTISRISKVNSRDLQKGRFDEKEEDRISDAIGQYANLAHRIYVFEADGVTTTTDVIKAKARKIKKLHNSDKILIAIDYLQLVPVSNNNNKSDKERVDRVCSDLKRIARELNSPVIAVSSLNRANYGASKSKGKTAGLDSFKESGGIEYSADLAMTMEEDKEATDTLTMQRNKIVRVVSLNIHKNRNGERASIIFEFDMPTSTFIEVDKRELQQTVTGFE